MAALVLQQLSQAAVSEPSDPYHLDIYSLTSYRSLPALIETK